MNMLLIEIIGCLLAAAFLSLFIGWAIRSALANRELEAANAGWESKQSQLELRYKEDTEELQGQVTRLEDEAKQLSSRNDNVSESLRENEISIHKARADAIELNRQQADTQERLQRIIAQKDEELKRLKTPSTGSAAAVGGVAAAGIAGAAAASASRNTDTDAKIAKLSAQKQAWDSERAQLVNSANEDQATVAIDPSDLPSESFDQTVRMDNEADRTLTLENDQTMLLDNNKRPKVPGYPQDDPTNKKPNGDDN